MADAPSPSATADPNPQRPQPDYQTPESNQPDFSSSSSSSQAPPPLPPSSTPPSSSSYASVAAVNPDSTATQIAAPPPPAVQTSAPPPISVGVMAPPTAPSFRPVPLPHPQFSPLPSPNFQNIGAQNPNIQVPLPVPVPVQPPGVTVASVMAYPQVPGVQPPNPAMRPPYAQHISNGYPNMATPAPQGTMPPPGVPRYASPYTPMIRPLFPRPPGAVGVLPTLSRPPFPMIRGPIIPPAVRPTVVPIVTPAEKPQPTVYVGKIASTVENDFMLSLLQLCGPVKSWKRAQDPTNGTPRGFGFCEFESAEGVLCALRLLSKFNVDGQELVLNVNQATREYLERFVEKKTESLKKVKETEEEVDNKEESTAVVTKDEPAKPSVDDSKKDGDDDSSNKENNDNTAFGIVTEKDREGDQETLKKLINMIEERLKNKPLPPPPVLAGADSSGNLDLEIHKSKDGDMNVDIAKNDAADDKNDDDTASENKPTSEQGKPETNSPDRSRRLDRNSRERDRERDLKREKERELERFERDRERERVRRERERELKIREAELLYKERIKDWENREREKDYHRQHEKDREKERQHQRRKEIRDQERDSDDDDDDSRKKRRRIEERRRKRLREKEEDLADRQKEVEEIAEAKRRADEEQQRQLQQQLQDEHEPTPQLQQVINGSEKLPAEESDVDGKATAIEHDDNNNENDSVHCTETGDGVLNGKNEESIVASEGRQIGSAPARKLGFGLVGSGKRTAVPSVFHEEEDDDAHKDKKMRPLVPIDYSTEEIQVVNPTVSVAAPLPPNLVSVAEAVKHGSSANTKEEKHDGERERSKRSHDRSSQRDRERNDEDTSRTREENREKILERDRNRDHGPNKMKTLENKKLLDAKQLIDMIPRTKEELFSYEINWSIYDKHELHERMRPWISKKITEFLGEEEASLVDYIVSSTQSHVKASQMLELLQSILDEEAEMFVLKMWRMLIFEIKKVETGLSMRSKT